MGARRRPEASPYLKSSKAAPQTPPPLRDKGPARRRARPEVWGGNTPAAGLRGARRGRETLAARPQLTQLAKEQRPRTPPMVRGGSGSDTDSSKMEARRARRLGELFTAAHGTSGRADGSKRHCRGSRGGSGARRAEAEGSAAVLRLGRGVQRQRGLGRGAAARLRCCRRSAASRSGLDETSKIIHSNLSPSNSKSTRPWH